MPPPENNPAKQAALQTWLARPYLFIGDTVQLVG